VWLAPLRLLVDVSVGVDETADENFGTELQHPTPEVLAEQEAMLRQLGGVKSSKAVSEEL
jgi:hypothetical protein